MFLLSCHTIIRRLHYLIAWLLSKQVTLDIFDELSHIFEVFFFKLSFFKFISNNFAQMFPRKYTEVHYVHELCDINGRVAEREYETCAYMCISVT